MPNFSEYLQPLTQWLQYHPNVALLITFVISFSESLAIIGSIIPGSVSMTAIGILAGSGVMPVHLTLISATLGAIAGDSASFFLGYLFCDRLQSLWPFSKYPSLLKYGQDYFAKHGGKSVLLGRFIGPLRSIIPVIAGMMHMKQWQFLLANSLSGIAWSFLYVGPGILIGTASNELSAESATHLFVFILMTLVCFWILGLAVKKLFIYLNQMLSASLHQFWKNGLNNITVSPYLKLVTPIHERNHFITAGLLAFLTTTVLITIALILFKNYSELCALIDHRVFDFLQSIHTRSFERIFVVISLVISPLSLLTFAFSLIFLCAYTQNWRLLGHLISLIFVAITLLWLISQGMDIARPSGLMKTRFGPSFPSLDLTIATSLFCFFTALFSHVSPTIHRLFKLGLIIILTSAGFAQIYLGDNWLSDILAAYSLGLSLALIHWLRFRIKLTYRRKKNILIGFLVVLFISSLFAVLFQYRTAVRNHEPVIAQYVLTEKAWWNQKSPILPLYCKNRLGEKSCLLNLQYQGELSPLKEALLAQGWQINEDSFMRSLIKRFSKNNPFQGLIWVTQLYRHKKPTLILTYTLKESQCKITLSFWRSNYHLYEFQEPIWLGSLHLSNTPTQTNQPQYQESSLLLSYFISNLTEFTLRKIYLKIDTPPKKVPSELLLIRGKPDNHAN